MTFLDELAKHLDSASDRHWLRLIDPTHLRCHECQQTIEIRLPAAPTHATPSVSHPLPLHAPDRCTQHPGERMGSCGRCRSEQLEGQRELDDRPTADVAAGAAAARQVLADLAARRRETETEEQPA
jgi:hypothetical protein